jgi:hypothetical protein
MPRGNASDPFCRDGIDFEGNRPGGRWGPEDLANVDHIDSKGNRKGLRSEDGIGSEPSVVDKPEIASDRRAKRTSSDECFPWNSTNYGTPPRRQE